jgi:hypothetical protein
LNEQISSSLTGVFKYAVVPFWALGTIVIVGAAITTSVPWPPLVFLAAVWVGIAYLCRVQRVVATDTGLLVGSADRPIPYSEIAKVTTFRFSNPEIVTVHLASGNKVRFFARYRVHMFSEHPIAASLRERAARGG